MSAENIKFFARSISCMINKTKYSITKQEATIEQEEHRKKGSVGRENFSLNISKKDYSLSF